MGFRRILLRPEKRFECSSWAVPTLRYYGLENREGKQNQKVAAVYWLTAVGVQYAFSHESREPRAESREPRAESREPRAESREPRAESREPRAESREPRAESQEPRAKIITCSPGRVRGLSGRLRRAAMLLAVLAVPAFASMFPGDALAQRATASSISSSPSRGSTYGAGETVTVRLAMSEAVLVTGRPYIVLDVGGVRRRAVYAGPIGSSTAVLDFSYAVQAGDFDIDGVALCARGAGCGRISLDGGSIRAADDGSAARLGHPALAAQSGHRVDAAAPLALMPPTACADEIRVPDDWPLKPTGVSAGGKFRLLFVTSTERNASSSNIADYNRFVQDRAAAGHSSIRAFNGGFRAVGSTSAVDARDNTCTTGTGVPIHWLNGNKAADDYADFYDGSWDDNIPKNESGNGISTVGILVKVFTGTDPDGTASADHYLGVASPATAVVAVLPATNPLSTSVADNAHAIARFYGLSQVFKVLEASDRAYTTDIAIVSSPAVGDAYRLDETVEVEVTYSEAVSVRGAPHIGLSVRSATGNSDNEYEAPYTRGTGTDKLIFAFTVPSGLKDDDGIQLHSDPLRLNGAGIAAVSDGTSAVWNLDAGRNIGGKVDTLRALTGGVCDRTPQVRDAIVGAVSAAIYCSQVTEAHLARVTERLENRAFEIRGLTSLAVGDFAGLSSMGYLALYGSGIETLPVGLFDGLDSLTTLRVETQLTHLPKDIFRGLGKVENMFLDGHFSPPANRNRLRVGGLPDGIFEPLSREVKTFWIWGSPGSDSFRPRAADAGPGGMLSAGQTVTLGGPGNDGGPWGSNVFYRWRQTDGGGDPASTVALPVTAEENVVANPSFTVPALAETTEVRFRLQLDGAGQTMDGSAHDLGSSVVLGLYSPVSEARFTILGLAPTWVAVVSKPVDGGDTYKGGEKIEVAVTFGDRMLVDTSLGTPTLGLTVGTQTRQATYAGGTGTHQLVFEYAVQSADADADGIAIAANSLDLGGGAIASVYGVQAILDHAALAALTSHKVDGSLTHSFDLTDGICARTPQVRDELLERVMANDSNVSTCSDVTTTHLGALIGTLDLGSKGIAVLKRGDFANLGGIDVLTLGHNDLTVLPAGVFEGLDDTLTDLYLHDNDLQTIAPGVFDGLTGSSLIIRLHENNLSSLPPRIFEKLTELAGLSLRFNPGSARFVPTAKAGPAGGIDVASGGRVTLGVEGAENGFEDPWGTNVTYSWSRTEGAGGTLTDAAAARAAFTAPVTGEDGAHAFRLTVTAVGVVNAPTADVAVRVAAGPKAVEAAFASAGGTAYAAGETIEVDLRFDRAVTVDTTSGMPSVALTVGAGSKGAGYLRGSGTRVLTFGYTVQAADVDADGVDLTANSLVLNGGSIVAVSDGGAAALGHPAHAGGTGRTVNSPAAEGICARTPAVQSAILERVRTAESDDSLLCGDITPVRLIAIGGRLDLSAQARNGRLTALRAGDFAWLANVTVLDLDNHALRSFPAGVFDPLTSLVELSIAYNQTQAADRMTTLPAGLFDRLTRLTALRLEHNDLESLPDGIFGKLTRLATLTLDGNPGSAGFRPVAVAGPAGGIEAETGERVTLGGDAGGPWGGNVVHAWRQVSGTAVALSATDAAKPAFAAPAVAAPENLVFELTVTGRGTSLTAADRVSVRIAAAASVSSVVPASTPIDGDTYRRGETIGVAVGFAKPVAVTGTPQLALSVGTQTRQAAYVRGSGTGQLLFEYTVVQADTDSDGIAIAADSLALAGGGIAAADGMAALLGHPALAAQAAHRVDGSLSHAFDPAAGICGRTAQVRDGLLLAVRAGTGDTGLDCSQVTGVHLGALTGTLILAHKGIGTLKPGDFANLGGITALDLDNNDLTALPSGVFEGLDDTLTALRLHDNDLQTIPAGVFDRLTGLTRLQLNGNNLLSLPPRTFEKLTGLTTLSLHGNPGSARFAPVARSGPEGGIEVVQGGSVTLGVADAAAGHDDPWGVNITYSWSQSTGTTVTYDAGKGADTARPVFTAPAADETLTFRLTVVGIGAASSGNVNRHRATSTVSVRVGAAGARPIPVGAKVNRATLTLAYAEDLRETAPAPASGKGPVFLAVVSEPGARRAIETARPSAVEVKGRQVKLTLDRPVEYNQVVTLSYFPDNAVAAGRVRDRGGNLAYGFAGLRVRNETPDAPSVQGIAFAGVAKTYGIGDAVGIDVTFSEPVAVTGGAPTLALEIGSAGRKARWKAGQAAGVVQRFEYTVAEDNEDTDGIAVEANGLAVPSGGSILTTAEREAVVPDHGRFHDPAHKVDGVRPTANSGVSEGPGVSLIWSEPLDANAVTGGAGGFTVNVPGAVNPTVTAVTISGAVVNLALNASIALGTTGVTVNYTPTATPIRDAAGNPAEAFPSPLAVTVAEDETAPVLAGAAVDGDTLTLTYSESLKVTGPEVAAYTVTVMGGGPLTPDNIRAGVGPGNTRVTMTLDPPAEHNQEVTLSYIPGNATTATKVQDLAGNAAAGFPPPLVTVENGTGAPTLALSKPQVTEGADAEVTLTLSTGGTTYATDRTFTISAGADATALETEDWTLPSKSVVLKAGQDTVTTKLATVDDARLEPAETVSFKASFGGAETTAAVLAIDDDDKAVLAVSGPAQVTEGGAVELVLRLEPHPESVANVSAVADDTCILDFPVTATLTRAGDTAALPSGAVLETDHDFAAISFDDCTREVTVSVPTLASDGAWMADRALTFALAPKAGSDERVEADEALQVEVRDDTPPPGPMVTGIAVTPLPEDASGDHTGPYTKEAFLALADEAVHGPGATLTFELTFDSAVTVTPGTDSMTNLPTRPELVLDLLEGERRARYTGQVGTPTDTMVFTWTVSKGDNDPDGLYVQEIKLNGGAIKDSQDRDTTPETFPKEHYKAHRVRGGLHAMRLVVSGSAREGEPFTVTVQRDGGFDAPAHAIVEVTDSGVKKLSGDVSNLTPEELQELRDYAPRLLSFPFDEASREDADPKVSVQTVTPPGDGVADGERTLTFELSATDVGESDRGISYWYVMGDPVEATASVTDTGLAGGDPDTPSLGVWDARTQEPTQEQWDRGRRFPLLFDVTVPWPNVLRPRGDGTVTVDYATRDGTATLADADYVATSGTLTFEAGETRKTVEVPVLPDVHDEGEETLTLVLSNATGAALERAEAVGTIRNNGPIPKAWIARFGRTLAEQMLEAVEGRMRAAPAPGVEMALAGEQIGVGSGSPGSGSPGSGSGAGGAGGAGGSEAEREAQSDEERLTDWLNRETGDEAQDQSRAVTPRDLLTGSSFTLTEETPGKDMVSFWGRGAVTSFDGREGDLTLDGEVATGMLGADWRRGRWTTGLILSHSSAEGGYSGASDAGDGSGAPGSGSGAGGASGTGGTGGSVEATLTGLFPWARHALSDRLEAWGLAGYGAGELTVTPKKPGTDESGAVIRADLDLRMAAVGLRGTLLDGGGDGLTLTAKTDAMVVQTASEQGRGADGGNLEPTRGTVTRLRLGLEASRPVLFDPGSVSPGSASGAGGAGGAGGGTTLTPSLEVGVRHDGGDAETGFGLDLGIGLALSDPERGLQAEMRARGLLAHESEGFRDLGFSGTFAWEGKPGSDLGAKLGLTQTIGGSSSGGADALLSRTTLDGLAANDSGSGSPGSASPGSVSGAGGAGEGDDELKRRRLELKFGYGLPAFSGRFTWTPEADIGLSDTGRDYSLGWRLVRSPGSGSPGPGSGAGGVSGDGGSLEISFEARRSESANDEPRHVIGFRLTSRF